VSEDTTGGIPDDQGQEEPTEEELRAAIEEQLRKLRVEDVLMQSLATLMSLAGRRLGLAPGSKGERDLSQARLAIEGARALAGVVPEAQAGPIREALSQLQLAFAREARGGETPPEDAGEEAEHGERVSGAPDAEPGADPAEAERAKARAKIWTPPGA
jgi:hypothetical protein